MDNKTTVDLAFPEFDNKEFETACRKDAVILASKITLAIHDYLDSVKDKPDELPSAYSIGAACYIASHLIGLQLDATRKDQVAKGLVATAILNSKNALLDLATNPPANKLPS